ncbi:hypothetical protein H106_06515 [Trichophyton rubrum CBS 735.88]|nr:hypothetical protein H106_06515 [Trichophyton rubrum CBS 735.88]
MSPTFNSEASPISKNFWIPGAPLVLGEGPGDLALVLDDAAAGSGARAKPRIILGKWLRGFSEVPNPLTEPNPWFVLPVLDEIVGGVAVDDAAVSSDAFVSDLLVLESRLVVPGRLRPPTSSASLSSSGCLEEMDGVGVGVRSPMFDPSSLTASSGGTVPAFTCTSFRASSSVLGTMGVPGRALSPWDIWTSFSLPNRNAKLLSRVLLMLFSPWSAVFRTISFAAPRAFAGGWKRSDSRC